MLGPGVERVVDPEFGLELAPVGPVDDLGHQGEGRFGAELALLDENLEGAEAVAVGVATTCPVEADRTLALGKCQDLSSRDVDDRSSWVKEPADELGR